MARTRDDDRIPPHNVEAEESLLGAALLARSAAEVVARVEASDFYRTDHRPIAAAIGRLADAGKPVDYVTVGEELRRTGESALVPEGRLAELMGYTPSITAAAHYADIVRDAAALRRLLYVAADISNIAYTSSDPAAALAAVSNIVDRLGGSIDTSVSTLEVADIAAILATDLEPESAAILSRTDGVALLYAGKMHMFQAEPTSGKTWVGLFAVVEVLMMGGAAAWIDYEDTPRGIIGRLMALGCDPEWLKRFRYIQPVGPLGPLELTRLHALLAELNPDVVIIDGVGEALSRDGLDENSPTDFVQWTEKLPRPIARTGAAVVMIDHVVKDRENQGRWARGTGAKLGVIDGASYQLKVSAPFSRSRAGSVRVVVAKDRPGNFAVGDVAAVVTITPHADGARVVIDVDPHVADRSSGDAWAPTHVMARVSELIASSSVPLTATGIRNALPHTKSRLVSDAISRLLEGGYISAGKGRTKTFASVLRYTDPDPLPARSSSSSSSMAEEPPPPPPRTDEEIDRLFE